MKKIKNPLLIKILLVLLIVLIFLFIIKECKLTNFCITIINLTSPLFFGYIIAWLLKPIMLKFNKKLSLRLSTCLTYGLIFILFALIIYFFVPIIIKEIKNIWPLITKLYAELPSELVKNMSLNEVGEKVLQIINNWTSNIKNIIANIFYSVFISFYFLLGHEKVTNFFKKYIPLNLKEEISTNLRIYVKGTLIDTLILFIISLITFYALKMPYSFLFAIIISITNIIPFIGPYIGGIPAILVAFGVNYKFGIIIFITIIILQFIESNFIQPYIMSKSLKINPIIIIIGLIIFGYFFGIIGMLISSPIISVASTLLKHYDIKKVLDK